MNKTKPEKYIEMGYKEEDEIAKNMLKENIDIKLIEKVTGLTEEEIKNIKKN